MEKKSVQIELSPLMASVMSRMVVSEIGLQELLKAKDAREGLQSRTETRNTIIGELSALRKQLGDAGYWYDD